MVFGHLVITLIQDLHFAIRIDISIDFGMWLWGLASI